MTRHINSTTSDIYPSSSEPAVYADRRDITKYPTEKTGVYSIEKFFNNDELEFKTRLRVRAAINTKICEALQDGRQYAVQVGEMTERDTKTFLDQPSKLFELTATVLLVHAADCQVGECCIESTFNSADYILRNGLMASGNMRFYPGDRDDAGEEICWGFERLEDGSGWRRIQ